MYKSFKSNIMISMQSLKTISQARKFGLIANILKPNKIAN